MPRCWSRRRAPARPRACRWCSPSEPWAAGKKIIVLEPRRLAARAAAARMAATLGETGRARPSAIACASAPRCRAATRIEVVTEGVFTRMVLDDPALDGVAARAVRRIPRALARRRSRPRAGARRAAGPARRSEAPGDVGDASTARGSAKLLGDAPVIESEGRAFPVETRYLGRDARAPIERQVADAVARALRAEPGSVLVFLPGAAEIRRTETLLQERIGDPAVDIVPLLRRARGRRAGPRHRAGAAGPAQGRAGDLDRRDLADHRGRAHRDRLRARARAALRAGRRAHAARDRAGVARRRRPAPRPRRPHRARRLLPAVGRAADRVARSRRARRKSSPPTCPAWCSISRIGASADPAKLAFLDPPPQAALVGGAGAAARAWRDRCATAASPTRAGRCGNCRCRRGSRAWWSMRAARRRGAARRRDRRWC